MVERQRPNRYARAGRNTRQEFRYLRTVIVTDRRLPRLRFALTTPRDLPAPGRRQTLYVVFDFSPESCVLINSRLDLFTVTDLSSGKSLHRNRHAARDYGAILPGSLTIVLRSPWYALPTHLCRFAVRAPPELPKGFSWKYGPGFTQLLRPTPQPSRSHYFSAYVPSRGRQNFA